MVGHAKYLFRKCESGSPRALPILFLYSICSSAVPHPPEFQVWISSVAVPVMLQRLHPLAQDSPLSLNPTSAPQLSLHGSDSPVYTLGRCTRTLCAWLCFRLETSKGVRHHWTVGPSDLLSTITMAQVYRPVNNHARSCVSAKWPGKMGEGSRMASWRW